MATSKKSICQARWQAQSGQSYRVVVGAADGATTGAYQVSISLGVQVPPVADRR